MLIQNVLSYEDFTNYLKTYKSIIVNVSAPWCGPCMSIKPHIEKFVSVVDNHDTIYLKIDNSIYDMESEFDLFFKVKKIPYFCHISDGKIVESYVSPDYIHVSKRMFNFVQKNSV